MVWLLLATFHRLLLRRNAVVLMLLDLAVIVDGGAFLRLFIHVELVTFIAVHLSLQIVAIALIFHPHNCRCHSQLLRGQQRGIY